MGVFRANRFSVTSLHFRSYPGCLKLSENHPGTNLIQKNRLDASVQSIDPSLILRTGFPNTHHLITIFIKFHFDTSLIIGGTSKTIITFQSLPRVNNLLHAANILLIIIGVFSLFVYYRSIIDKLYPLFPITLLIVEEFIDVFHIGLIFTRFSAGEYPSAHIIFISIMSYILRQSNPFFFNSAS